MPKSTLNAAVWAVFSLLASAATVRADTVFVAATGSDSSAGTYAAPVKSISRGVGMLRAGDVLLIGSGTYHDSVLIGGDKSGTARNPTIIAGVDRDGVIVDGFLGTDSLSALMVVGPECRWVTIRNMTFRNAKNGMQGLNAAVRLHGVHNTAENLIVEHAVGAGFSLQSCDSCLVDGVVAQDNWEFGFCGYKSTNSVVRNCIARRNNTGWSFNPAPDSGDNVSFQALDGKFYSSPGWASGGGKWVWCDSVLFENYSAYGNGGAGLWFDWGNTNIVIRKSSFKGNFSVPGPSSNPERYGWSGVGLFLENHIEGWGGGFLIDSCILEGNEAAQVRFAESRVIVLKNSSLIGKNGIEFREMNSRASKYYVGSVKHDTTGFFPDDSIFIYRNKFERTADGRHVITTTGAADWTPDSCAAKAIFMDSNIYAGSEAPKIQWGTTDYTGLASIRDILQYELHLRHPLI